jgi:hypothetical protein
MSLAIWLPGRCPECCSHCLFDLVPQRARPPIGIRHRCHSSSCSWFSPCRLAHMFEASISQFPGT